MYIIKVKGKSIIPDHIQLRDESYIMFAYFRADKPIKSLVKYGLGGKEEKLQRIISTLEYGKMQRIEL